MKYLVLDTCTIIHIIRNNEIGKEAINWINDIKPQPIQVISAVTKVELETFALIAGWQKSKLSFLYRFFKGVTQVDILHTDQLLFDNYKLIDGFSKCKINSPDGNLKKGSSIKMGKNDLWIAATAKTINATLLTCDGDFYHLDNILISVKKL